MITAEMGLRRNSPFQSRTIPELHRLITVVVPSNASHHLSDPRKKSFGRTGQWGFRMNILVTVKCKSTHTPLEIHNFKFHKRTNSRKKRVPQRNLPVTHGERTHTHKSKENNTHNTIENHAGCKYMSN